MSQYKNYLIWTLPKLSHDMDELPKGLPVSIQLSNREWTSHGPMLATDVRHAVKKAIRGFGDYSHIIGWEENDFKESKRLSCESCGIDPADESDSDFLFACLHACLTGDAFVIMQPDLHNKLTEVKVELCEEGVGEYTPATIAQK